MNQPPDLSRTWAVVAGIDQYQDSAIGDLKHQVDHACRFTRWLCDRGVPPSQIFLFLSPARPDLDLGVKLFPDAHLNTIFDALDGPIREQRQQQDLLM
ncbi:MAG: hypothetical protein ACREEM_38320, partial [Blastocatellia bacterium]